MMPNRAQASLGLTAITAKWVGPGLGGGGGGTLTLYVQAFVAKQVAQGRAWNATGRAHKS